MPQYLLCLALGNPFSGLPWVGTLQSQRALYFRMRRLLPLFILAASTVLAQSSYKTVRVILPASPGSISVDLTDGQKIENFALYIDGMHGSSPIYRPVLLTYNMQTSLRASYILFVNDTSAPTAEACRAADRGSIEPAKKYAREHDESITEVKESSYTTPSGRTIPIASHMVDSKQHGALHQIDLHAFIGDSSNCATLHLSKDKYEPTDDKLFGSLIDRFITDYQKDYVPTAPDYAALAEILTRQKQSSAASVYTGRAAAIQTLARN